MTKTLTEQWREGTLDGGIYYLLLRDGTTVADQTIYIVGEKQLRWSFSSFDFVKEVLEPVPSYDEYKELVFKANMPKNPVSDTIMCYDTERERAVVEKLQEQISEANKLILWCARKSWTGNQEEDDFDRYLAKWGVK